MYHETLGTQQWPEQTKVLAVKALTCERKKTTILCTWCVLSIKLKKMKLIRKVLNQNTFGRQGSATELPGQAQVPAEPTTQPAGTSREKGCSPGGAGRDL